jgi:ribosomal RNA assembly protein
MMSTRIPVERIGALIGKNGEVKAEVQRRTGVIIKIESKSGDITLDDRKAQDPTMVLKVMDFVSAVGNGFSADGAYLLLGEDYFLEVFDIRTYVGKDPNHITRMRARVIGRNGRTRQIIEELAEVQMSIQGNMVAVIGDSEGMESARIALDMLLNGSEHRSVYSFLEKKRREMKIAALGTAVEYREDI